MKVPVTIKTSYKKAEVPSLVDSGATDNFIHPRTVRQLRLKTVPLERPKKLFNVDDTQNKSGKVTHYVKLEVTAHRHCQPMSFLVSDIRKEDIILGYPWLIAFEPRFQWRKGKLDPAYLPITCQSTGSTASPGVPTTDQKCRIIRQLENDCAVRTIATDIAIEAEKDKKEVTLPSEYQRYASVFSEEEAQCFPPSRAWDHAIDFKKGVPNAINCPIYPMTRTEDKALDDFIDEQLAKGYI